VVEISLQKKCYSRMKQLREKGTTMLFVSHSLGAVTSFCERGLYLRRGMQVAIGQAAEIARQYEQDCLAEKMNPLEIVRGPLPDSTGRQVVKSAGGENLKRLVLATWNGRDRFVKTVANGSREGTRSATVESFTILRDDGSVAEAISPTDELTACFLVRFNRSLDVDVHMSLIVHDKFGNPVIVIRDSHFEERFMVEAGSLYLATMKFRLSVQAGIYFGKVGVLLYPKGQKYFGGQHNFESSEVADLIEHAVHFEVLPFLRHSIHVPVLAEAKMSVSMVDI
jgi:ABC-type glutathione transport system ATPase component